MLAAGRPARPGQGSGWHRSSRMTCRAYPTRVSARQDERDRIRAPRISDGDLIPSPRSDPSRCVLVSCLVLLGCAARGPERDTAHIDALLAERGAPALGWNTEADDTTVREWLAGPMTMDVAVRTALLRSPRMQQEYARIGLARAEVMEAVRTGNPRLSIASLAPESGGTNQLTAELTIPVVDLLMLPVHLRSASTNLGRAKREIAAAVLNTVADVESAWYAAVAARQVAELRNAVADVMATSAELAQRFYEAGNISELQLAREQAAASQARVDATRASIGSTLSRLELDTTLGLGGADADWTTRARLPLPVTEEDDPAELARLAREGNLSLVAARQEQAILEDRLGVTRIFGWLGGSAIGYEVERDLDGTIVRGPTADLELPVFDQGRAELTRARAQLAQSRARVGELELTIDNSVRMGSERVRALGEVVRLHREALIPQRETIVARSQQEQNFMLIGVFELIQAKTQEYDAYQSYIEAVRDYWVARAELMRAVGAVLPSSARIEAETPGIDEILTPPTPTGMP